MHDYFVRKGERMTALSKKYIDKMKKVTKCFDCGGKLGKSCFVPYGKFCAKCNKYAIPSKKKMMDLNDLD